MRYFLIFVVSLAGALDIAVAVSAFNRQTYFLAGFNVFLAIWMAALLVKIV